MSSETQVTISYEAMKAELEAAGYGVVITDMKTEFFTPDGMAIECNFTLHIERAIDKAWAHYQEKKRYAAMEALLRAMIDEKLYMDTDSNCHPSTQLLGWIRRAEELFK